MLVIFVFFTERGGDVNHFYHTNEVTQDEHKLRSKPTKRDKSGLHFPEIPLKSLKNIKKEGPSIRNTTSTNNDHKDSHDHHDDPVFPPRERRRIVRRRDEDEDEDEDDHDGNGGIKIPTTVIDDPINCTDSGTQMRNHTIVMHDVETGTVIEYSEAAVDNHTSLREIGIGDQLEVEEIGVGNHLEREEVGVGNYIDLKEVAIGTSLGLHDIGMQTHQELHEIGVGNSIEIESESLIIPSVTSILSDISSPSHISSPPNTTILHSVQILEQDLEDMRDLMFNLSEAHSIAPSAGNSEEEVPVVFTRNDLHQSFEMFDEHGNYNLSRLDIVNSIPLDLLIDQEISLPHLSVPTLRSILIPEDNDNYWGENGSFHLSRVPTTRSIMLDNANEEEIRLSQLPILQSQSLHEKESLPEIESISPMSSPTPRRSARIIDDENDF